jgi:hypothetical protein
VETHDLKDYLAAKTGEGLLAGSQGFTIAVEDALRKLAAFQLPFPEAWILKFVQAVVTSDDSQHLAIALSSKCASIHCAAFKRWTGESVLKALADPTPADDRALRHLVCALRCLSLQLKRNFCLRLGEVGQGLSWDGERFTLMKTLPADSPALRVDYPRGKGFGLSSNSDINASLLCLLSAYACTSPIPLSVDGRRLDTLLNATGLGSPGVPLALGWVDGERPAWRVPEFTALSLRSRVPALGIGELEDDPIPKATSIACLVLGHPPAYGPPAKSACYWIKDGVITSHDFIFRGKSKAGSSSDEPAYRASVALFLDARDLETDVSDFYLRDSRERAEQIESAAKAVSELVERVTVPVPQSSLQAFKKAPLRGKLVVGFLGGLFVINPMFWLIFGILGGKDHFLKAKTMQACQQGLAQLQRAWRARFGQGNPTDP